METTNTQIRSHRDLIVWQRGMDLVDEIYDLAEKFPNRERFGLWSQITRAAVSVPTNIAEGQARGTSKDFANFLTMSWSSLMEIDTLLLIAVRRKYLQQSQTTRAFSLATEISKMLVALRKRIRAGRTDQ